MSDFSLDSLQEQLNGLKSMLEEKTSEKADDTASSPDAALKAEEVSDVIAEDSKPEEIQENLDNAKEKIEAGYILLLLFPLLLLQFESFRFFCPFILGR